MRLFLFLLVAVGMGAVQAAPSDCAAIDDPQERLACYDQRFPREPAAEEVQAVPESRAPRREAVREVVDETTDEGPKPRKHRRDQSRPRDGQNRDDGGGFLGRERHEIVSAIRAVRSRDKQKMVFLLDNGQMWIQTSPRTLPIREGDRVSIKSGLAGGFMLRTQKGVATRVTRIN